MLKFFLGIILGVFTLLGILITLLALYPVYYLAFKKKSSPIYVIAASNLSIDLIQLLLAFFYLSPSIVSNNWLFPGKRNDPVVKYLSDIFLFCWYNLSVSQIIMAVNRLVVVCLPSFSFFTYSVVCVFVILLYPASLSLCVVSQHYTPCCAFSFDQELNSYSYTTIENVINFSNEYIDLPLNTLSSSICAFCYITLIVYVRRSTNKVLLSQNARHKRNMKEYMYAVQFCVISVFYLFSWVLFRVLPPFVILFDGSVNWFIFIPICVSINSSANALVYLLANNEVKRILLQRMLPIINKVPFYFSYARKTAPAVQGSSRISELAK